jgi:predicted dehydrogenase
MLQETHPPHSAHVKMNRGELLNPEWVGDPKVTGGFLYETTIHMFDMMRFLFGEGRDHSGRWFLARICRDG